MTYHGRIEHGQVVFNDAIELPEGAAVTVIVAPQSTNGGQETADPTLLERLKNFVGSAKNLPPDASVNVDHYLYGLPKK
jgi:hypothetical protein